MLRILTLLACLAGLLGASPWLVPMAKSSLRLMEARNDPAAIADLGLEDLDGKKVQQRIEGALLDGDVALATSFMELAEAKALPISDGVRAQVEAANSSASAMLRSALNFGEGFVSGEPSDMAGIAGALAGDLMVWGDLRDAGLEGWKLARGEEADELLFGLSAVGLAATAGTYASAGTALPVRAGVTIVKIAKRTGRLSAQLRRTFTRAVKESVNLPALRRLGTTTDAIEDAGLKGVVRTNRMGGLTRMLGDLGTVQAKAGTRAALEGMRVAEGSGDLKRLALLSEAKGGQTLAILKTLKRGAFVITGLLLQLVWWGFATLVYIYLLISTVNALCVATVRLLWRRKDRRAGEGAPALAGAPFVAGIVATGMPAGGGPPRFVLVTPSPGPAAAPVDARFAAAVEQARALRDPEPPATAHLAPRGAPPQASSQAPPPQGGALRVGMLQATSLKAVSPQAGSAADVSRFPASAAAPLGPQGSAPAGSPLGAKVLKFPGRDGRKAPVFGK